MQVLHIASLDAHAKKLKSGTLILKTVPQHLLERTAQARKFVPVLGVILKELALEGRSCYGISHFKFDRPGVLQKEAASPKREAKRLRSNRNPMQLMA